MKYSCTLLPSREETGPDLMENHFKIGRSVYSTPAFFPPWLCLCTSSSSSLSRRIELKVIPPKKEIRAWSNVRVPSILTQCGQKKLRSARRQLEDMII